MLNRSPYPAYQQNGTPAGIPAHSGDGRSQGQKMTPSPFVPNYSGDGHGKPAGWSGDGQGSVQEPQPIWSGGGRHDVHNPMMPTWGNTNGRFAQRHAGRAPIETTAGTTSTFGTASQMSVAPAREQHQQTRQVPLSDELVMNVNVGSGDVAFESMKTARKSSGTWKLIALVVVFLVWVSTASTLLFLYMDRYLFP
ncbi:hypothetical protein HQ496_03255 [bacterium]|nr:hypothetical protein [bacterium]